MLAVAFPRAARVVLAASATLICVGVAAPAAPAQKLGKKALAELLLKRDPGARVGGLTQVSTQPEAVLMSPPARVNFMMSLAPGQRLIGGQEHDQLGARLLAPRQTEASAAGLRGVGTRFHGRGGHDLIHGGGGHDFVIAGRGHDHVLGKGGHDRLVGGHGHDVIRGGPGHDRLHGGHGNDRFIDKQGNTTVVPGPGRHHIDVSDGGTDRVLCHPDSVNRIVVDRGDRLHRHCRNARSSVSYGRPASEAPAARAAQQSVIGDGTNDSPFTAECVDLQNVDCTVTAFARRTLQGLWDNEYVPAYQCATSHPYLVNKSYAPGGTSLPNGVAANGLGAIGMFITGIRSSEGVFPSFDRYAIGTKTGFPDSSVTNWGFGRNSYQVQLHCSNNDDNGYTLGSRLR
jgi:RTX calcium-binding nonapeptide repeat (4 copies)